ncbi:MAG: ABC transporter substrate-binding protein, partial [Proteobacteria bacterium]|nr:ABC transporter substrate-binding protein [Pseudomonadota bacterium]
MRWICRFVALSLFIFMAAPVTAGPLAVRIAKQPGVAYLPLMVMEHEKLLEKRAKEAGLDITTEWLIFTGGSVMNDALLSGRLDIATGGIPPLLTIWAKTRSNLNVKGIAALSSHPQLLLTTNPKVKTIADFTSADKIALPAVKVSNQAVMLQMAAIKQMGKDKAFAIDPFTVSMGHGDAMAAMLGGSIDAHFGQSPYQDIELKDPRVHAVLNSYDAVGGPYPVAVAYATGRFFEQNPKMLDVFVGALMEAQERIRSDINYAAKVWIAMDVKNFSMDEAKAILSNPKMTWDAAPRGTLTFLKHMNNVGLV